MDLRSHIRSIPDYPKPGIVFRDITTLIENGPALRAAANALMGSCCSMEIDKVAVIESRGFILGSIVAYLLGAGIVIIRKKGKLPYTTRTVEYSLEYGVDILEVHEDSIKPGERILLHDDLLATGGTMAAAADLVQQLGGTIVGASFLVELAFLPGRERLLEIGVPRIDALVTYNSEDEV